MATVVSLRSCDSIFRILPLVVSQEIPLSHCTPCPNVPRSPLKCLGLILLTCFVCKHGNIRPGNTTISLFFSALKNFKIDNIENLSSQGVPLIYLFIFIGLYICILLICDNVSFAGRCGLEKMVRVRGGSNLGAACLNCRPTEYRLNSCAG